MKAFFNRDNAFKMILFSSILIMALYQFFFNGVYVAQITSFLGLLTFILSLINMIVLVLEKLIEKHNCEIQDIQNVLEYNELEDIWEIIYDIVDYKKGKLRNRIKERNDTQENKDLIVKYWFTAKYRRTIRKIRRILLFFYFATITAILAFLFLSHELLPFIQHLNFGNWTIFSFVIILFEILIKDELADGIYWTIDNSMTKAIKGFLKTMGDNIDG